jgi:hypothetical protein
MPDVVTTPAQIISEPRSATTPRQFAYAFVFATVVVLLAGWFSGVRETANVAMGSVLSVAFLPFVIISLILFILIFAMMWAVVASLFAGELLVAAVVEAAREGAIGATAEGLGTINIPGYYRWLFSIRHPYFWGSFAGIFFGALLLFALIALFITPGERQTAQVLKAAQLRIDQTYAYTGDYPAPTASGGLLLDGVTVTDGFGRPVKYTVTGKWKVKSYNLSSSGYDGVASDDDMSVSGAMGLAKAINLVKGTIDGLKDAYNAINEMKKNKPQP